MGRKAKPPVVIDEPAINHDAIAKSHADMNELARTNAETSDNAHALAVQFGYEGALTVGAVEDVLRLDRSWRLNEINRREAYASPKTLPGPE